MPKKLRTLIIVAALVSVPFLAATAAADKVFHTLHADLQAVNGAPLKSGFVNDVHTNGVVNGAVEIYQLNGARPNTTYQVSILLYPGDPTCSSTPLVFPTSTVTTNTAGNGTGRFKFPAAPPGPLSGIQSGIAWIFTGPNGVDYRTGCNLLTLD
jgi:hypothetical protein